ncbi:hypothetical protein ACH4GE_24460 [Streptomyces tendae]|uniref:hypothetical protein n=1 Tax=Streptomyces tendae TaxID=1932 RepID=UPI0037AD1324
MTDLPTSLPCSTATLRQPHPPHDWEPQPGMNPVHCPGQSETAADWHAAGCARDCSEQHTYTWGRCALAPQSARPEPTISIGRVETEADGQPGIVLRSIPLTAWDALITVAKWVSRGKSMALDADPAIAPAYPDAAARRALGALHDAGLLDPTEPHLAAVQAAARAEGTDTATWTAVRAIQLMNEAGQQRDKALAAVARVRELADDAEYGTCTVDVDTLRSVLPDPPTDTLPETVKET